MGMSQAACWPFSAGVRARGVALERVKLACPLRCPLSCLFLLCALGLDAPCGVVDREVAEFVGVGMSDRGSRTGVLGVSVRVDDAHPELVTTG
ncbi:MAG TPA: hypothetical protein PKY27_07025, partial [Arachnia sp.]|nr:hypothetical protein [Arachnia sp.]